MLTVLDEEFAAAERVLGPLQEVPNTGCYDQPDGRREAVVMQSADRTNVAAQEAVGDLIEFFRPEVVIVCGIGGGVEGKDGIRTGDVVVASYLHYSEFRKLSEQGDHDRYLAYDQPSAMLRSRQVHPVRRSEEWKNRIDVEPPDGGHDPKVLVGPVLAGEKVMGKPEHHEHQRAIGRFTDAIAVDMESYGAARAIHTSRVDVDYNPLLLVVRGISDIVRRPRVPGDEIDEKADRANDAERQLWKPYACSAAAAFTAAMADRLLSLPDLRPDLRAGTSGAAGPHG